MRDINPRILSILRFISFKRFTFFRPLFFQNAFFDAPDAPPLPFSAPPPSGPLAPDLPLVTVQTLALRKESAA